jgi:hypothetical protein
MPRKKRTLDRDSGVVRDASLVIIASEDTHAVSQYFRRFRTRRVVFKVLHTQDCHSSPRDVMTRLQTYRAEEATVEGDQFWVCIDTDHWIEPNHIANLTDVLRECRQKNYQVAVSNPCFELWLLLHFVPLDPGQESCRCEVIEKQLRSFAGAYQKHNVSALSLTEESVYEAIERATKLDCDNQALPTKLMTRVYRLLNVLIERESINLHTMQE